MIAGKEISWLWRMEQRIVDSSGFNVNYYEWNVMKTDSKKRFWTYYLFFDIFIHFFLIQIIL